MQPIAVPPAAAIRAVVLRKLPPGLFWKVPAALVVMVMVVLPVPPEDNATLAVCVPVLPNP
jgi:hypothetical protein